MHFREAYDPFRAFKSSFEILKSAPAAVLVGGLLLWVCDLAMGAWPNLADINFHIDANEWRNVDQATREFVERFGGALAGVGVLFVLLAATLAFAALFFRFVIQIGMAAAIERALVTGQDEIGDLFKAQGRWLSMALAWLLVWLIGAIAVVPGLALGGVSGVTAYFATEEPEIAVMVGVAALLLYVPVYVYVILGLSLARFGVAIEGLGPTEAISRSWYLVRGNRLTLLLYHLVLFLGRLCGCLDCCLLFLPTAVVETCMIDSYLRLVREGEPAQWGRVERAGDTTPSV